MITRVNEQGTLCVASNVFTDIAGIAATNCFGVKGMAARSVRDGLYHLLRMESMSKGVKVTTNEDGTVSIDLHIIVDHGINLPVVTKSIVSEVRYVVEKYTDVKVTSVKVFIDSMNVE